FLQASLLTPLYDFDAQSSPRGLPIRFQEVTPVRKPGKKATTQQKAAYREAKKTRRKEHPWSVSGTGLGGFERPACPGFDGCDLQRNALERLGNLRTKAYQS